MKKILGFTFLVLVVFSIIIAGCASTGDGKGGVSVISGMRKSKLLLVLPDYIKTPDGMAIDKYGNLVLSCPNFADDKTNGCIVKISKDLTVTKWFDVPVNPETGVVRNMGIDFDNDWNLWIVDNQPWSGKPELQNKGRVLKVTVDDAGKILKTTVVAKGIEHPNGLKIKDGYCYVSVSSMSPVKRPDGLLTSGVYRFRLNDENITVNNNLSDRNLLVSYVTRNPEVQYGIDGLVFDQKGNLYVGNFGDGEVFRITFNPDGSVASNTSFAKNSAQLATTDGMCFGPEGILYIADFSPNAIAMVTPDGKVQRIAQSPDNNGIGGGIDQPGEPIFWNGKLVFCNFDMVTDPGKVNTKHNEPCSLGYLDLYK